MALEVDMMQSGPAGVAVTAGQAGCERPIPDESLNMVDWERAYIDLLEHKERKGLTNLVIPTDAPRRIMATSAPARLYRLVADESVVRPESFGGKRLLQEAVSNILRKYTDDFYRVRREQWESHHMVYRTLDESDPNFSLNRQGVREGKPGGYVLKVLKSKRELISAIQKLIEKADALYMQESRELPRIYFDRHLYQPLLVEYDDKAIMSPPGLKPSEAQFVRDLKEFWAREKDNSLAGRQVFLLRNLSRGGGIGFFEEREFYPDFILWIIDGKNQHLVFIEPHGMIYANAYQHDEKARLHETLPGLAGEIAARSKMKARVTLDSYIISATPFDDLRKKYDDGTWDRKKFAAKHILFLERDGTYDYLNIIFKDQRRKHNA